jgi:ubiquinone/menaquinone biosynthesis C-methylase UbiE
MRCNTQRGGYLQFDKVAELYDRIRPGYPVELYKDIFDYAKLDQNAVALEIGCGSGQATEVFARQELKILAVDPGSNLVKLARTKLASYSSVEFACSTFEDAVLPRRHFSLVFSATAFHWVPASIAYTKSHEVLRDGGAIALFWNLMPVPEDVVQTELSGILDRNHSGLAQATFSAGRKNEVQEGIQELRESGLFEDVAQQVYDWTLCLTAKEYVQLLATFAHFQSLSESVQESVYSDVDRFISTHLNGAISLNYKTILNLGRAKNHEH